MRHCPGARLTCTPRQEEWDLNFSCVTLKGSLFHYVAKSFNWPESAYRQVSVVQTNSLARTGHPVSYWAYLRLSFFRPSSGLFAVAAIPAARSFAMRTMSFTGTCSVSGKWTVPFRSS